MDASPYEWIPGIKCSLHGAIDDAKSNHQKNLLLFLTVPDSRYC